MYLAPLNYDRFFKKIFSDEGIAKQFLEDFFEFTIEEIELLPVDHKLTNEANLLSFDYRCKVKGKYLIIEMQQWYKHDVVKRFYLYHAANTVVQLENLPYKDIDRERKIKDYDGLLPVLTLVWMVDDGLKFQQESVSFTTLPKELLHFVRDEPLWKDENCSSLIKKRENILQLIDNDAKGLSFLQENELIFAFQREIVKAENSEKPYAKWFKFADKTRNSENTKEDFREYANDPVFAQIIRKLNHKSLNKSDWEYINYYDEMLGVMEAKIRDSRAEGIIEGKAKGIIEGEMNTKRATALRCLKMGMDIEQTSTISGLSIEDIHLLQQEN